MSSKKKHSSQKSSSTKSTPSKNTSSKNNPKPASKTTSKATPKPIQKKRGFWLALILIVIILHSLAAAIFFNVYRNKPIIEVQREWILTLTILHFLANVVAAVGMWMWKKWGYYVYIASSLVGLFAGLVTIGIWASFYMILPLAITGYVVMAKWKDFE
jgi:hypothetical protein